LFICSVISFSTRIASYMSSREVSCLSMASHPWCTLSLCPFPSCPALNVTFIVCIEVAVLVYSIEHGGDTVKRECHQIASSQSVWAVLLLGQTVNKGNRFIRQCGQVKTSTWLGKGAIFTP
jgi:hypothetical protein